MSQAAVEQLGRILVIIPTYNEIENVDMITSRLRTHVPSADILIVDDNSPDGTGKRADELAETDEHINVLHRQGKEGLGAAYLAGFKWGLERDYDILVEFDADGSHQPEQLPSVLVALHEADMVKGSRWVKGGSVVNWPLHRQVLSWGGSTYTRLLLGLPVRDVTGGLNAFRADTLRAIIDKPIDKAGYGIQRDLTVNAHRAGFKIAEVPIEFKEREHGLSKMDGSVLAEALKRTTQLGVDYRLGQLKQFRGTAEHAGETAGRFVGAVNRAAREALRDLKQGKDA